MEKAFSKKQYIILLVVSAVLAIVLPMVSPLFFKFVLQDNGTSSVFSYVNLLFQVAAYAIFVFVCLRCRFEWCLPFIAVLFVGFIRYGLQLNWIIFLVIATFFAFLGITKLCGKLIKNELVAASVALVLVFILDRVFFAADMAASFVMIGHFSTQIMASFIRETVTPFWHPILNVLCMFVTYFIVRKAVRPFSPAAPAAPEAIRG